MFEISPLLHHPIYKQQCMHILNLHAFVISQARYNIFLNKVVEGTQKNLLLSIISDFFWYLVFFVKLAVIIENVTIVICLLRWHIS